MRHFRTTLPFFAAALGLCIVAIAGQFAHGASIDPEPTLSFSTHSNEATYQIGVRGQAAPVLTASLAVQVDGKWLRAADYPKREVSQSNTSGLLGPARQWTLTYSGLEGAPALICDITIFKDKPYGEIQLIARNRSTKTVHVEAFRLIDAGPGAQSGTILNLGGAAAEDRVLSYSFSEDEPAVAVHDLRDSDHGMHRAVGSQLVYNRQSGLSWFLGALTTDRFLTVIRIHVQGSGDKAGIGAFQADSEGTTELQDGLYLRDDPPADHITLSLPLAPGASLASEKLLFSVSHNYHKQLETYGELVGKIHHARVGAAPAFGWWSWTAYYSGISAGTALTNAQFLAQNLKRYGYDFFHIDEGYEYARGEYTTPDATLFPDGMIPLEDKAVALGLVPGLWTAPFDVSNRSSIYQHHKDWLVHNAEGKPIQIGHGANETDDIYALDPTNPAAQEYLRKEYTTLVKDWHIRYIKLDFMEAAAIEGYRYRPDTTALEAQRIGLQVIREAVGPHVLLDKDGSPMLNPVGYVDMGRISEDTGHTFAATKEVAPGIAARYFMNRKLFLDDPDAFTVSKQTIPDGEWHESSIPLTLDEAKASIALAAVAGGMFEIGDDLPTLGESPDRMALVKNTDLLDMVRRGEASIPVDLMTYEPADEQPSIFYLKEDARQSILTVFDWTESSRSHAIRLTKLGLDPAGKYTVSNVLEHQAAVPVEDGTIEITQPRHSVRVLKIIDENIPASAPKPKADHPESGKTGEPVSFHAEPAPGAIHFAWRMGDGVTLEGATVSHTYTHAGDFTVTLFTKGLDGLVGEQSFHILISGSISHRFVPAQKRRFIAK